MQQQEKIETDLQRGSDTHSEGGHRHTEEGGHTYRLRTVTNTRESSHTYKKETKSDQLTYGYESIQKGTTAQGEPAIREGTTVQVQERLAPQQGPDQLTYGSLTESLELIQKELAELLTEDYTQIEAKGENIGSDGLIKEIKEIKEKHELGKNTPTEGGTPTEVSMDSTDSTSYESAETESDWITEEEEEDWTWDPGFQYRKGQQSQTNKVGKGGDNTEDTNNIYEPTWNHGPTVQTQLDESRGGQPPGKQDWTKRLAIEVGPHRRASDEDESVELDTLGRGTRGQKHYKNELPHSREWNRNQDTPTQGYAKVNGSQHEDATRGKRPITKGEYGPSLESNLRTRNLRTSRK